MIPYWDGWGLSRRLSEKRIPVQGGFCVQKSLVERTRLILSDAQEVLDTRATTDYLLPKCTERSMLFP